MPSLPALTSKRRRILQFIWNHQQSHGFAPNYREIKDEVGLKAVSAVSYQIHQLERAGYIERAGQVARGTTMTGKARLLFDPGEIDGVVGANILHLPIMGIIQAGAPVEFFAVAEEERVVVNQDMLPRQSKPLNALRVRGDSMIDALITDGDVVILEQTTDISNGDMVAAWLELDQKLTLKYLFREGPQIRLQPANRTMKPFYTPAANVRVQGRVVLVVRQHLSGESKQIIQTLQISFGQDKNRPVLSVVHVSTPGREDPIQPNWRDRSQIIGRSKCRLQFLAGLPMPFESR